MNNVVKNAIVGACCATSLSYGNTNATSLEYDINKMHYKSLMYQQSTQNPQVKERPIVDINMLLLSKEAWVLKFIEQYPTLFDLKSIKPYYSNIRLLLRQENFLLYSTLLEKIEVNKLDDTLIVGLLRLSFMQKEKIPYWRPFLEKAYGVLSSKYNSQYASESLVGLV
jgi:hypothetical protein